MKPDTRKAMRNLIEQIRQAMPFDLSADEICADECKSCAIKLLEYLASELDSWEYRLAQRENPSFRDLSRLEKSARKIYRALQKNGLIQAEASE